MGEFRRASSELKSTWDHEMQQIEETAPIEAAEEYHEQINNYDDSSYYDYGAYDSGTSDSTATSSQSVANPQHWALNKRPHSKRDGTGGSAVEAAPAGRRRRSEGTVAGHGSCGYRETGRRLIG
jgi:hypothetical protein